MVRTPNLSTAVYVPSQPPSDPALLQGFLFEEFKRIQAALQALQAGHYDKTYVAPEKPRDGDIRYADGTGFKPNGAGGAGIWYFNGSTWIQLG